ncbi:hypothetical protein DJ568_00355 [Mucilaginibacter hurinus]|uniref:Uncharacterized protein n=1 Tax=Mucilaginibacter hurinus TaxID=2201324 RepID=A0A367GSD2_9SPHI|nr:hypothetical protein [Mucilaginibacter hurinus]RCH56347.1 hypothetical protein DJ568_00355 [Mucilaginibacter hurinus]
MDSFTLAVRTNEEEHIFEVADYLHHDGERCKFKIYQAGELVASFEPDANGHLHVCKNPGGINNQVLHLLADKIEAHHFHE